jgi:hypothetical protein
MDPGNPRQIPIEPNVRMQVGKEDTVRAKKVSKYSEVFGSLYLGAGTRPDVAYAVNTLA